MVAWLAVPLTLFTVYCVYSPPFGLTEGAQVLWVAVPLALYLIWVVTSPKPGLSDAAIQRIRRFEVFDESADTTSDDPAGEPSPFRSAPRRRKATRTVVLKTVVAAPFDLAFLLERLGGGPPKVVFELHPRIAYAAVVEASELALSDHFTLLLRLEDPAPTFSVRPIVTTEAPPADLVSFKKDLEFNLRFHVIGKDSKAVRGFLSAVVRDALLDMPNISLEAQGKALSLSVFGPLDSEEARRLIEVADVVFAEYGAEEGPTLLEPSGESVAKKKKKKPGASQAIVST